MRSNEFIIEKKLDEFSDTAGGIRKELVKKGYTFLGKGVDQSAYLEPGTGLVLKVFGTQSGYGLTGKGKPQFTPDQKMFIIFANYCMMHKDNPFLPKFYGFESFVWKGNHYLQIRQELLKKKISVGEKVASVAGIISILPGKSTEETASNFINKKVDEWDMGWYRDFSKKLGPKNTALLLMTLLDLYRISRKKGYVWDLHEANVMVRSDGFPVIVDPWVVGW